MKPGTISFDEAVALVQGTDDPAEVFVDGVTSYRRLVRILHPDVAPVGRTAAATAATARLAALWAAKTPVLQTRRHRWVVGDGYATGDLATLREVTDGDLYGLLKLPRDPADGDLARAEIDALARLVAEGDPRHRAYAPRLLDTVVHDEPATGVRRTGPVLERLDGFVSLAEVARHHPDGLDPRDAAWMWRRLLVGLGWAHRAGVVHGAVLPEHVLIHPAAHGLALVDWCYSVRPGDRITAIVARHRDRYPPEVPARRPATPATDLYAAADLMARLVGPRLPAPLRRFADGCRLDRPTMRPDDAWRLLAELDDLLHDLYGPRRFRPFTLPA
ncbi:protein kinase family protein [Plantactinospora sonchi]|uniref:Molecular chaperone DnaJ n=1 Tax=Plantactinospora sonchi TaxID=1544735 RepID=A0ABU7RQI7_9ACTN